MKGRSKNPKDDPLTFWFTSGGISELLKLQPDAIAMEPTGMHYSAFLAKVCEVEGITIFWVGHQEAVHYRKQHKLPDKNDWADALALGSYAYLYKEQPSYFIQFPAGKLAKIRELFLQQKSLCRFRTPLINRCKQQLAHEFPEAAGVKSGSASKDGRRPLFVWLARRERPLQRTNNYWEKKYRESVACAYNLEISGFTRQLATQIDDYDIWERELRASLTALVYDSEFEKYNQVFDLFNFGLILRSCLLSSIYPISNYEGEAQFKRRIGATRDEIQSGDSQSWKTGSGSKLTRCELYLWAVSVIARPTCRPNSDVGQKITDFYDDWLKKFRENPQEFENQLLEKQRQKSVQKAMAQLKGGLSTLLKKDSTQALNEQMQLIEASLVQSLSFSKKGLGNPNKVETKRKFGKLILGKTIGYTARWLYRILCRSV